MQTLINILIVVWTMSIVTSLMLMLFLSLEWLIAVFRWCVRIDDELSGKNIITPFIDKVVGILLWTMWVSSIALYLLVV